MSRRTVSAVYAITDRRRAGRESAAELAGLFFGSGIKTVQIREKDLSDGKLLEIVASAHALAEPEKGFRLVVNDRADIARIVGCGVHLGEDDLPASAARSLLGPDRLIGLSTHDEAAAQQAFASADVDYVAFGPIFASATKSGRLPVGLEKLSLVARSKSKPLVAVGGIRLEDLDAVWDAGADSAAMISALNTPAPGEAASRAMDLARRRGIPGRVWLVGFMGCGKTTLGAILARRLQRPFFDLDEEIEKVSGRTVRAIFETEGEPEFRRREKAFVEGAVGLPAAVIAAGGGTFIPEDNRTAIRHGGVAVFLDVPFEILARRVGTKRDRPLFTEEAQARRLFEERLPFYKMAPVRAALNGLEPPERAAELVLQSLDERTCVT